MTNTQRDLVSTSVSNVGLTSLSVAQTDCVFLCEGELTNQFHIALAVVEGVAASVDFDTFNSCTDPSWTEVVTSSQTSCAVSLANESSISTILKTQRYVDRVNIVSTGQRHNCRVLSCCLT